MLQNPNESVLQMLNVFLSLVESNQDTDFTQAMLNNYLQNHNDIIVQDLELTSIVSKIKDVLKHKFEQMESLINSNVCMSMYFAGINAF